MPIYLDNGGTTFVPSVVKTQMDKFFNVGNASSNYASAKRSQELIKATKEFIAEKCHFSLDDYEVILTSGASESISTTLEAFALAYRKNTNRLGHIITSKIEHKATLRACERLEYYELATVTYLSPDYTGKIRPSDIKKAIKASTCLIFIMHVNSELGVINPIYDYAQIAHDGYKHNSSGLMIPFCTDAVQSFGKFPIQPKDLIDGFCVSFHKMHGPQGIGATILRKELIEDYGIQGVICGSQNGGLRGGTENPSLIAGALSAMINTWKDREKKNIKLQENKEYLIDLLSNNFIVISYLKYLEYRAQGNNRPFSHPTIILLSCTGIEQCSPSTLLMSITSPNKKMCNVNLQKELETRGVIVGIGSACNSKSKDASHVLQAIGASAEIKRGTIRITTSDYTTREELTQFAKVLFDTYKAHRGQ